MATVLEPPLASAAVSGSSDKSIGFVFAAAFALIGGWPLVRGGMPRWWTVAIAAAFALVAFFQPRLLRPLNRVWQMLGRVLHKVASPLVMLVIFFLCVTPIAAVMRWRGKDVLSLKRRPDLSSYWITRDPAPPAAETMKRQF